MITRVSVLVGKQVGKKYKVFPGKDVLSNYCEKQTQTQTYKHTHAYVYMYVHSTHTLHTYMNEEKDKFNHKPAVAFLYKEQKVESPSTNSRFRTRGRNQRNIKEP